MNSSGSSPAPSMPVPRHYYQLELRPPDRIAPTFHSGFENRPLLCPDWSSALLAFPSTPAPIGRRRLPHPNHRAEIILTLFQQPLHVFSRVTATIEVERDFHAVFSFSHDPGGPNPDSLAFALRS